MAQPVIERVISRLTGLFAIAEGSPASERHQRGQASTRLFVLGITSWASEKTQGGEHSQPCLSPAASVSIKAAMTAVPEPGMDADDAPVSLAF